jgi:hypothetical protein
MVVGGKWTHQILTNLLFRLKQGTFQATTKYSGSSLLCNNKIQWKQLIMITLGLALFDNNNRLITLSGGYKHLHYLTQFIVTVQPFTIKIRGSNC